MTVVSSTIKNLPETQQPVKLNRATKIETEKKRLRKASKEMESLFLYQMLKSMRKTIPEVDSENSLGLGSGAGKDTYMQMFDQELALKMSGSSSKSIAESIYRSMEQALERQFNVDENKPVDQNILPTRNYIKISSEKNTISNTKPVATKHTEKNNLLPQYEKIIKSTAKKYDLDPSLINSVIKAESNGNPKAVSSAGAKGLMQLIDSTASDMGVTDVFDPEQNIEGGSKYLRQMLDRFGDIKQALAAYNAGPEAVNIPI